MEKPTSGAWCAALAFSNYPFRKIIYIHKSFSQKNHLFRSVHSLTETPKTPAPDAIAMASLALHRVIRMVQPPLHRH